MIKILTPLKTGSSIPTECSVAIYKQTAQCTRLICDTHAAASDDILDKRNSQTANLNALLKHIEPTDEYVLLLDHDVLLTSSTDVQDMIEYLDAHPEVDACAYDTKDVGSVSNTKKFYHVIIACCMVRASKLSGYLLKADSEHCMCVDFNKTFEIEYVDARKLNEIKGLN